MNTARFGRRDFLVSCAGVAAAFAGRPPAAAAAGAPRAAPTFMYVGCFSSKDRGDGKGISVYRREAASGTWALAQLLEDDLNPSFLAIARDGRTLYSVHGGTGSYASAYRIDEETGRLSRLNQQPVKGSNPVHLAIDATGRFLIVANYATGGLAVLPIAPDGTLGALTDLVALTGTPGPHRQQGGANPHACPFDPTGRYVVVPDKGVDGIHLLRFDASTGKLESSTALSVPTRSGAGPRHVDFHPTKPYAYVINELDSTMTAYEFRPDQQLLKPFQIVTTLPARYTGNNTGAEIWVAPSGRFVYGSNRGHDSIAIFAINQSTGELTAVGWEPTRGATPRFFAIDPTGTHLYAANQEGDSIVVFRINQKTGKLTATGEVLNTPSPCTIVFAR